jgi:hypothetical protein
VALAAAVLRDRRRLIILLLAVGLFVFLAWQVRAAAAISSPPSPDASAAGGCHKQP